MYSPEEVDKQLQDLWSFVWRIKYGGINPSSIFGTWFAGGAGVNGALSAANSPFTPAASSPFSLYPIDTTGGVVRVNTPSGALQDGQVIFFKDIAGNFGVAPFLFRRQQRRRRDGGGGAERGHFWSNEHSLRSRRLSRV